jgi:predicted metalloendopeptidase
MKDRFVISANCLFNALWAALFCLIFLLPSWAQSALSPSGHGGMNAGPDLSAIDQGVAPCQDFYQYACGNWIKDNPIPPDRAFWAKFSGFVSENDFLLRSIMDEAAQKKNDRSHIEQIVGDYYDSCMDERVLQKQGVAPLRAELQAIGSTNSRSDLTSTLATLHSLGVQGLFTLSVRRGFADSSTFIVEVDSGGTTLPGRDYYVNPDPKTSEIRKKYFEHLARTFQLAGDNAVQAETEARAVLEIETALAQASLDASARRDPKNLNHMKTVEELSLLVPSIAWPEFFREAGVPVFQKFNVAEPEFFNALNKLLKSKLRESLKSYLRWQVIDFFSPGLPENFAAENFEFQGKVLSGRDAIEPRWKRCMNLVNQQLADGVGQLYVTRTLQPEDKNRVLQIMEAEKAILSASIRSSSWMSEETKRNALAKLDNLILRVGYPDSWRDYSSLKIQHDNLLRAYADVNRFLVRRSLQKIGKPASNREWSMVPQTIDASYEPQENSMNFPAAILRPPYYGTSANPAANYGAIGVIIGHELTHSFDDEGRKFDERGNLHDWWTEADSRQFDERTQCFVNQYDNFEVLPGLRANGKLTLGENIADNAGVRLAYTAWMSALDDQEKAALERPGADGLTPVQDFFLTYAQLWCQNMNEAYMRQRTISNEHSLPPLRVNGVVQNMLEFRTAFSCKPPDKMVRQSTCRLW